MIFQDNVIKEYLKNVYFINSTTNVENAKLICNTTLKDINVARCRQIKNSQYFWIERNDNSTVEETIHKVEQHFQW